MNTRKGALAAIAVAGALSACGSGSGPSASTVEHCFFGTYLNSSVGATGSGPVKPVCWPATGGTVCTPGAKVWSCSVPGLHGDPALGGTFDVSYDGQRLSWQKH